MTLGRLRFAAGQLDAAIDAFRQASRLDIYDGRALSGVAEFELERGRPDAALQAQLEKEAENWNRLSAAISIVVQTT